MGMYDWIDPFEEIRRLEFAASRAREEGEQAVMRAVKGEFRQSFRLAVDLLAERTARKVVEPHMARTVDEAANRERHGKRLAGALVRSVGGLVEAIESAGEMHLSTMVERDEFTLSFGVEQPFRFNYVLTRGSHR